MKKEVKATAASRGSIYVGMEDIAEVIAERIALGQSVELSPRGISMRPLLREGRDTVTFTRAPERLKKYDLPLYRRADGKYVLHRVVGFHNGRYVMCGDNQYKKEQGIDHGQIIAIVSAISRDGRQVNLRGPLYRAYVVLWCESRPLRYLAYRVLRKIKRILLK